MIHQHFLVAAQTQLTLPPWTRVAGVKKADVTSVSSRSTGALTWTSILLWARSLRYISIINRELG
ncbi:hypothetical protein E2C01_069080 [Portunus trituberculatus]|uniref:Uncharacterized protein n=1 Tax=Portunus trituberculatus TaxID=210409 RepID=A0A5B7HYA5_PORTR|nr:hypothetical protein [Portunus trituberculatus]